MTLRRQDWPEQLHDYLIEVEGRPFAWGTHDCVTMAANGIQRMLGEDPLDDLRGQWTDAKSAAQMMRLVGGLEQALEIRFARLAGPLFAQRGDVGLVLNDGREILALCNGAWWAAPGVDGMVILPLKDAVAAWAVGRVL